MFKLLVFLVTFKKNQKDKITGRRINMKQQQWRGVLRKQFSWLILRIIPLVLVQLLVEITFRMKLLFFLGPEEVQSLVYDALYKLLLTFYVWFFLVVFKRFAVPIITTTISPAVNKLVREPKARKKTQRTVERYLNYANYIIGIIAFVSIWLYSYIGVWLGGFLGTGLVVMLTFVLGLFTSSILGNVLAYWVLNNTMEFKIGDRVQVGEAYGDVAELGFFFIRIKTIKDELISIPNLAFMGKEVKNFSALSEVLIHIPVTLGYDVDKEDAKKLLIKSAEETNGILKGDNKKPFVLFLDLGKYTVTYEINAYTDKPNELITIKSDLIDNILREFKESKIELLSPAHIALREAASKDF